MGNLLSTNTRFYFNGVDPGLHGTRFTVTLEGAVLDPTAIVDNAERVHPGDRMDSFEYAGFFDDDIGSSTLGLEAIAGTSVGISTAKVLMMLLGTSTGAPAYCGTGYWLSYKPVANIRDLVRVEGTWAMDQAYDRCQHFGPKVTVTTTTNSGSIDNGAGGTTTAGGTFYLQVFEVTSGTSTIKMEDSTDGTTFVQQSIVTATAAKGDSLKVALSGRVDRYIRLRNENPAGTLSYAGAFIRG